MTTLGKFLDDIKDYTLYRQLNIWLEDEDDRLRPVTDNPAPYLSWYILNTEADGGKLTIVITQHLPHQP